MTFDEESLISLGENIRGLTGYNLENKIATKGVRRFLERWRKKYKKSVRHWLVTELGGNGTERIHIHGIIWTDKTGIEISERWGYGIVTIGKRKYEKGKQISKGDTGYINNKSINYIVKYINKIDEKHREYDSKIMTSSGIGRRYIKGHNIKLNKYKKNETNEAYTTREGIKLAMPIYYRNKIYTEKEREKLWIEKLDKEERWVNGVKVDISKGEEDYYEVLEEARKKNKRLGYGDNTINWERRNYENERRNIIKEARIRKQYE